MAKKLPKSVRKYLRTEKAKIRREKGMEAEEEVKKLKSKFPPPKTSGK